MSQIQNNTRNIVQNAIPQSVVFTENAAKQAWNLIAGEGNFNLNLRVYITGGGCSGFQYGFTFDETIKETDTVVTTPLNFNSEKSEAAVDGSATLEPSAEESVAVNLLIDPTSMMYLVGAKIDYSEGIEGGQFIIHNPNAQTTCGCGSSFSV